MIHFNIICVFFFSSLFVFAGGCASLSTKDGLETVGSETVAVKTFNEGVRSTDSELMYQLLAGELAGHLGELEASVNHYSEAAKLSEDPQIAQRATKIALYAGNFDAGLRSGERWVKLTPTSTDAQQTLATLYMRRGEIEKAIPHLEAIVNATNAAEGGGIVLVGTILAREKDKQTALKTMELLAQRYPESAHTHFAVANLALGANKFHKAIEASTKALEFQSNYTAARTVRARALFNLEETDKALEDMKTAVASSPENTELQISYGRMLVQAKKYEKARAVFNKLRVKQPENTDLMYMLGLLDLQSQHYDEAEHNFKALVDSGKRADEGQYYLGRVAEAREQYEQAADWYKKVNDGEYFLDAQARVAEMYAKLGRLDQARAHFKKLRDDTSDDDTSIKLYLAEGQLLREIQRYEEGVDIYSRALTEHPRNSDLLYARAMMAEKINRMDVLEADLNTIIADDPKNVTALNALGYTLADRNERIPEALQYIQRAFDARPDDPTIIDSMGWVQYRMGNYQQAEQYVRKAYSLLDDAAIAGHLSEIMWELGNKSEARELLEKALKTDPQDEYLLKIKHRFSQ